MCKKLGFCLLFFLFIFLVGCNNNVILNELPDVSMIIKDGTLTSTSATIVITDLTSNNYTYGEWFRIDEKVNGKWKEVKRKTDDYFFNLIGYNVDENNELVLEHNWDDIYGKLESGKYRIVKEVDNKYISAEFVIN